MEGGEAEALMEEARAALADAGFGELARRQLHECIGPHTLPAHSHIETCQDTLSDCETHKANGGCHRTNKHRHYKWRPGCLYTCGYCDDPRYNVAKQPETCRDTIPNCQGHKKNGGCLATNQYHHAWRRACVHTCGYCDDPRYNPKHQQHSWQHYIASQPDTCHDTIPHCETHMKNGGCSEGNAQHHYKWRPGCVYTCGYCDDPRYNVAAQPETCRDTNPNCQAHKKNGGCLASNDAHDIWRTWCVHTCGNCYVPQYNPNYQEHVSNFRIGESCNRPSDCPTMGWANEGKCIRGGAWNIKECRDGQPGAPCNNPSDCVKLPDLNEVTHLCSLPVRPVSPCCALLTSYPPFMRTGKVH